MNHGTKALEFPDLTANLLRDGSCLIDNLFADLWKQMGMKARPDSRFRGNRRVTRLMDNLGSDHSHSIVAGGFPEIS